MPFDISKIRDLAKLPDDELRMLLSGVLVALGMSPQKAAQQLSDIGKIKQKLAGVTEAEIRLLTAAVGEEKIKALQDSLTDRR